MYISYTVAQFNFSNREQDHHYRQFPPRIKYVGRFRIISLSWFKEGPDSVVELVRRWTKTSDGGMKIAINATQIR